MSQFCIVFLDETDRYVDEGLVSRTGKIFGVYIFDTTKQTHCCEITPSFELHYVETQTEKSISDEDDELIRDANAQNDPVIYMHVAAVERLPLVHDDPAPRGPLISHRIIPSSYDGSEALYESIEEAIEDQCANPICI